MLQAQLNGNISSEAIEEAGGYLSKVAWIRVAVPPGDLEGRVVVGQATVHTAGRGHKE